MQTEIFHLLVGFSAAVRPALLCPPVRAPGRAAAPMAQLLFGDEAAAQPGIGEPKPPPFDFAPASSRPDEVVHGAAAAPSAAELGDWLAHMQGAGIRRAVAFLSADEAAARSPDGTAGGYAAALSAAGVGSPLVLDAASPAAAAALTDACTAARSAREKLVVHCADGRSSTNLALATWLLRDYIGSENVAEACDLLSASRRKTKVERRLDPAALAAFVGVEYVPPKEDGGLATGAIQELAPDGAPPEEPSSGDGGGGPTRLSSGLYIG